MAATQGRVGKKMSKAEARILAIEKAARAERRTEEKKKRMANFKVIDCQKRAVDNWWRSRVAAREQDGLEFLPIHIEPDCKGETSTRDYLISAWRDEETGKAYLRKDRLRRSEACIYNLLNYDELVGSRLLRELEANAEKAYKYYNIPISQYASRRC